MVQDKPHIRVSPFVSMLITAMSRLQDVVPVSMSRDML